MFINKFNNQPNFSTQKMSSYINVFLKTEITCIPKFLSNIFGEYYNNTLCNGATWVFFLWCILHTIFDKCFDAFLRKLRYREYVRSRLRSSLWYLGFYGTGLVYCSATLVQNEINFFNVKKLHLSWNNPNNLANLIVPIPVVLGHIVISTFYLHSAFWEGFIRDSYMNMLNYLLLFVFTVTSYTSGIPEIFEISLKLTAVISAAQLALEFTRCIFMSYVQESFISKLIAASVFFGTLFAYIVVYLVIVPLICIVRLGLSIMSDNPHVLSVFLFFNLLAWLGTDIYCSVLFRFVNHWLYHQNENNKLKESIDSLDKMDDVVACDNTIFECSLFKPRDDLAYHMRKIRNEIQQRRNNRIQECYDSKIRAMAMRKPKNMLFQTLKCMVAIKRKLSEKRLSETSDSESKDSDSDKSENNESKSSDNTDDEAAEGNSEESDEDFENEKVDNALKKEPKIVSEPKNSSSELEEDNDERESTSSEESTGDDSEDEEICSCPKNTENTENQEEKRLLETKGSSTIVGTSEEIICNCPESAENKENQEEKKVLQTKESSTIVDSAALAVGDEVMEENEPNSKNDDKKVA